MMRIDILIHLQSAHECLDDQNTRKASEYVKQS